MSQSLAAGVPIVSTGAHGTHIEGLGNGTSPEFELDGDMVLTIGVCQANDTSPFVWLRTHNGGLAGQFVDPINHVAALTGKYHLVVVANPSCAWAADITPE